MPQIEAAMRAAMRMLDNVIAPNFCPAPKARTANLRHHAVGMGVMGFQNALYALDIGYASAKAMEFVDRSTEALSYFTLLSFAGLAEERGSYPTFPGSKLSQADLPDVSGAI